MQSQAFAIKNSSFNTQLFLNISLLQHSHYRLNGHFMSPIDQCTLGLCVQQLRKLKKVYRY